MPDITYELHVEAGEEQPIAMQVISYDSEGENLGGVRVRLEMVEPNGSFDKDAQVTSIDLSTDPRGKAYFNWSPWPPSEAPRDTVCLIRATWEGRDPFVFVERFRETWDPGV